MPFILLDTDYIETFEDLKDGLYEGVSPKQIELNKKIGSSDTLLSRVRWYRREYEMLYNYYANRANEPVKLGGFKTYAAYVKAAEWGEEKQPTLICAGMYGADYNWTHENEYDRNLLRPGDVVIAGCGFFDVKRYPPVDKYSLLQEMNDIANGTINSDGLFSKRYVITSKRDVFNSQLPQVGSQRYRGDRAGQKSVVSQDHLLKTLSAGLELDENALRKNLKLDNKNILPTPFAVELLLKKEKRIYNQQFLYSLYRESKVDNSPLKKQPNFNDPK